VDSPHKPPKNPSGGREDGKTDDELRNEWQSTVAEARSDAMVFPGLFETFDLLFGRTAKGSPLVKTETQVQPSVRIEEIDDGLSSSTVAVSVPSAPVASPSLVTPTESAVTSRHNPVPFKRTTSTRNQKRSQRPDPDLDRLCNLLESESNSEKKQKIENSNRPSFVACKQFVDRADDSKDTMLNFLQGVGLRAPLTSNAVTVLFAHQITNAQLLACCGDDELRDMFSASDVAIVKLVLSAACKTLRTLIGL